VVRRIVEEVRHTLRSLRLKPVVPAVVVSTVGLAIAVNVSLFSVVDGLLFRPLPYRNAHEIVHVQLDSFARASVPRSEREAIIDRANRSGLLVNRAEAGVDLMFDPTSDAVAEWGLRPASIEPAVFDLLGVEPFLGPRFAAVGAADPAAVLIGYDIWVARFHRDPGIIGRLLDLPPSRRGVRWRVAGVMPRGFSFPTAANMWVQAERSYDQLRPYARLATGVSIEQARAGLPGVTLTPLREHVRPGGALALGFLFVGAALLFAVALVQVSGLLLVQSLSRVQEFGVRIALGASKKDLVWQSTTEALLLIGFATILGLLVAGPLTALVVRSLPPEIANGQRLDLGWRTLVWAVGIAGLSLAIFTWIPLEIIRRLPAARLLHNNLASLNTLRPRFVQTILFVGQITIVTALMYLTGLMVRTYSNTVNADLGFDPQNLYAVQLSRGDNLVFGNSRASLDRQRTLVDETLRDLAGLPGVAAVAGSHSWPMKPRGLVTDTFPSGIDPDQRPIVGRYVVVTPGYSSIMGHRPGSGSEPTAAELSAQAGSPSAQQLVAVNETLARQLSAFGSPVGQVLRNRFRVVAVLPDFSLENAGLSPAPTVFHYLPPPATPTVLLFRLMPGATLESAGVSALLSRVWGNHARTPFAVETAVYLAASDQRARAFLLSLVALMTIPMVTVGIAGAIAFSVKQQTPEIALRLAIGAQPGGIRNAVIVRALRHSAIGVSAGLALSLAIAHLSRNSLAGVDPIDAVTIAGCALVVLFVATIAAAIPGRRASRIDPALALRHGHSQ